MMKSSYHRRDFLRHSLSLLSVPLLPLSASGNGLKEAACTVPVSGHLWLYASMFPPDWNCAPVMEQVFADFRYAGMQGVELMEVNLRDKKAVERLAELSAKYAVPVTGTSYHAPMWNHTCHAPIREDAAMVIERLSALGGSTFGITVGNANRQKTEDELDAQAEILYFILDQCSQHGIQPNMHNHTFEVENNMHDLKGTLARIPELKLGPDINWLIRAGVDPLLFIEAYGDRIVYLHIRDQDAAGQWTKSLGEGVTDYPAIAAVLHNLKFCERAAIELAFEEKPSGDLRDYWKNSRAYVKQVFGW
jgi:sugar phosphate isomerase/epimerase